MTYKVFGGTLSLTQSINYNDLSGSGHVQFCRTDCSLQTVLAHGQQTVTLTL